MQATVRCVQQIFLPPSSYKTGSIHQLRVSSFYFFANVTFFSFSYLSRHQTFKEELIGYFFKNWKYVVVNNKEHLLGLVTVIVIQFNIVAEGFLMSNKN